MAENIKEEARRQGFSVSEFIRAAVRLYQEERILRFAKKAEKEYKAGKLREIKSFKELRD